MGQIEENEAVKCEEVFAEGVSFQIWISCLIHIWRQLLQNLLKDETYSALNKESVRTAL